MLLHSLLGCTLLVSWTAKVPLGRSIHKVVPVNPVCPAVWSDRMGPDQYVWFSSNPRPWALFGTAQGHSASDSCGMQIGLTHRVVVVEDKINRPWLEHFDARVGPVVQDHLAEYAEIVCG